MQWWGWLIVLVVAIGVIVGLVIAVQARRRKGGVIIDPAGPAGRSRTGGGA